MARIKTWVLMTDDARARIRQRLDGRDGENGSGSVGTKDAAPVRAVPSGLSGPAAPSGGAGHRRETQTGSDPVLKDMKDFAQDTPCAPGSHRRAGRLDRLAILASSRKLASLHGQGPSATPGAVRPAIPVNPVGRRSDDLRRAVFGTHREETEA